MYRFLALLLTLTVFMPSTAYTQVAPPTNNEFLQVNGMYHLWIKSEQEIKRIRVSNRGITEIDDLQIPQVSNDFLYTTGITSLPGYRVGVIQKEFPSKTYLSIFGRYQQQWRHDTLSGWRGGTPAYLANHVYVNASRRNSAGLGQGIIRFPLAPKSAADVPFHITDAESYGAIKMGRFYKYSGGAVVGLEMIYALRDAHNIDILDPDTGELVRTIHYSGTFMRDLAVDPSNADIHVLGHGSTLWKFNFQGHFVSARDLAKTMGWPLGTELIDIDIDPNGQMVIGAEHGHVAYTNTRFQFPVDIQHFDNAVNLAFVRN